MMEKIAPDSSLKIRNCNCTYLWINSLKFYSLPLMYVGAWGHIYIEMNVLSTCFYLNKAFSKNK